MRFYEGQHEFYCGVDLHTRAMYVCIVDQKGQVVIHRNIPTDEKAFLRLIEPYRRDLAVCVECMLRWTTTWPGSSLFPIPGQGSTRQSVKSITFRRSLACADGGRRLHTIIPSRSGKRPPAAMK